MRRHIKSAALAAAQQEEADAQIRGTVETPLLPFSKVLS